MYCIYNYGLVKLVVFVVRCKDTSLFGEERMVTIDLQNYLGLLLIQHI